MHILLIILALMLSGCGQMGDLYLPKPSKNKTTDHVQQVDSERTRYEQEQFDQDAKEQDTNNLGEADELFSKP
jgi:predicted small lipoprotein YifL